MNLTDAVSALYSLANLCYLIADELDSAADLKQKLPAKRKAQKKKAAPKAKKAPAKKPVAKATLDKGAEYYTVRSATRGRIPSWVLKQTGLANKQEVITKYGDGFKFVEGMTPIID